MSSIFQQKTKIIEIIMRIDRIVKLQNEKGISDAILNRECELNHSSMYDWKRGRTKPSAEAIIKIARYFGVTSDYLLGLSDNPHGYNTP